MNICNWSPTRSSVNINHSLLINACSLVPLFPAVLSSFPEGDAAGSGSWFYGAASVQKPEEGDRQVVQEPSGVTIVVGVYVEY